jgi:hypothetical protein
MKIILYQLLWCGSLNATTTTMAFHVPMPERALNALFEISTCTDLASIIRIRPYNFKESKNLVGFNLIGYIYNIIFFKIRKNNIILVFDIKMMSF